MTRRYALLPVFSSLRHTLCRKRGAIPRQSEKGWQERCPGRPRGLGVGRRGRVVWPAAISAITRQIAAWNPAFMATCACDFGRRKARCGFGGGYGASGGFGRRGVVSTALVPAKGSSGPPADRWPRLVGVHLASPTICFSIEKRATQ